MMLVPLLVPTLAVRLAISTSVDVLLPAKRPDLSMVRPLFIGRLAEQR